MLTATKLHPETDNGIELRLATVNDVGVILGFICGLADFEKLSHEVSATEDVLRLNLFGPKHYAECLLAEVDSRPAGFALFFHNFSTFIGKPGLYLEDLYIDPAFRGQGLGSRFFSELAKIALARDCARMEWSVLDWNEPAIKFYKKLRAKPMSEWTVQRLTRTEIEALAKS